MEQARRSKSARASTKGSTKGKAKGMSAPRLASMVTSIGYSVPKIASAKSLKMRPQELKEWLGGKGAGLAGMAKLGVPVPPAFNLSTALCQTFLMHGKLPESVKQNCRLAMKGLEKTLGKSFGKSVNPLLVSVRSGARVSMPGMMDTVLNLGLNQSLTRSLAQEYPERAAFWWDCYRRFIAMYADVVLDLDRSEFEEQLEKKKSEAGVENDHELSASDFEDLSLGFLELVSKQGEKFPEEPWEQLFSTIEAVFRSWNTDRAVHYRELNSIPDEWGTSVTVQAMVFGNMGEDSGTGVVFSRDPSTGEKKLYGEYLLNAQGEDVVAGTRTPKDILELKNQMPKVFTQLKKTLSNLESHFNDVQDVEFTVESSNLFVLQTRSAKRTATAALEHALQFVREKKLTPEQALERISYDQIKQLLHPSLKPTKETPVGRGLPASPGAVSGVVVFSSERAVELGRSGESVILVRKETSPEDIVGMSASVGILTATGGMTSHAAVVGRGMGKSCIVGCSDLRIEESGKCASLNGAEIVEGAKLTLNASRGDIYLGELPTEALSWNEAAQKFFGWADRTANMSVLANADTPEQALLARDLGARGIGLCRTEHMFFELDRIRSFRKVVLSDEASRQEYIGELLPFQKEDFVGILREMNKYSVCVRLLDPPLHEFLPREGDTEELERLSSELGINLSELRSRIRQAAEVNPMLGHRGCRLGITFCEIYEMQIRALAQAQLESLKSGIQTELKIMIPLVIDPKELEFLLPRLKEVFETELDGLDSKLARKLRRLVKWGTMIELPRACVVADQIAPLVDFISFGTNDLTQTSLGISRDDAAKFVPSYLEHQILADEPFEVLDRAGVGALVEMAVEKSRSENSTIEIGVCGEHGGDPKSIAFFDDLQFHTVSCSPFRVPIARLAAGRVNSEKKKKRTMRGRKKKK